MTEEVTALVSGKITDGSGGIGYMFRDEWTDSDSGWRFYTGDEDPLFLMEPGCMEQIGIAEMASRFPEIGELLDLPSGSAFRRDENGKLVPAKQEEENGRIILMNALAGRTRRHAPLLALIAAAAALTLLIIAAVRLMW